MDNSILVRSLEELISLGTGQGRQDSFQSALNNLNQQGYALVGVVPDSSPEPSQKQQPWFIFRKDS